MLRPGVYVKEEPYRRVQEGLKEYLLLYKGLIPEKEKVAEYLENMAKDLTLLKLQAQELGIFNDLYGDYKGVERIVLGLPTEMLQRLSRGEYREFLMKTIVDGHNPNSLTIFLKYGLLPENEKGNNLIDYNVALSKHSLEKKGAGLIWSKLIYPQNQPEKITIKEEYLPLPARKLESMCKYFIRKLDEIPDLSENFTENLSRLPLGILVGFAENIQLKKMMLREEIN